MQISFSTDRCFVEQDTYIPTYGTLRRHLAHLKDEHSRGVCMAILIALVRQEKKERQEKLTMSVVRVGKRFGARARASLDMHNTRYPRTCTAGVTEGRACDRGALYCL